MLHLLKATFKEHKLEFECGENLPVILDEDEDVSIGYSTEH